MLYWFPSILVRSVWTKFGGEFGPVLHMQGGRKLLVSFPRFLFLHLSEMIQDRDKKLWQGNCSVDELREDDQYRAVAPQSDLFRSMLKRRVGQLLLGVGAWQFDVALAEVDVSRLLRLRLLLHLCRRRCG